MGGHAGYAFQGRHRPGKNHIELPAVSFRPFLFYLHIGQTQLDFGLGQKASLLAAAVEQHELQVREVYGQRYARQACAAAGIDDRTALLEVPQP